MIFPLVLWLSILFLTTLLFPTWILSWVKCLVFFLFDVHSFCWIHDNFSCLLCSPNRIPFVFTVSDVVLKFQSADSQCPPRSLGVLILGIINSSCKNADTCAISWFIYADSSFDYQLSFFAFVFASFCWIACVKMNHIFSLPETDIPLVSHLLSSGVYEWSYLNMNSGFFTFWHSWPCY